MSLEVTSRNPSVALAKEDKRCRFSQDKEKSPHLCRVLAGTLECYSEASSVKSVIHPKGVIKNSKKIKEQKKPTKPAGIASDRLLVDIAVQ